MNKSRHSVITEYMLSLMLTLSFDWNNIQILDSELNYNKRLSFEMLYIKEQFNDINLQKNIDFLDDSYFCLLDAFSNYHSRHILFVTPINI